jgi:carboxylesterase type B
MANAIWIKIHFLKSKFNIFEPLNLLSGFFYLNTKLMKYSLLTKEQLEALNDKFALFLASQQIDTIEWDQIKKNKPAVAEQELEVFSDFVWETVLTKATYLEHSSRHHLNLFCCEVDNIKRIYIKTTNQFVDLSTNEGIDWLLKNIKGDEVEVFKGTKKYSKERNIELFELVEKGSIIAEGKIYNTISQLIA